MKTSRPPTPKIAVGICCFQDSEFLESVVNSIYKHVDTVFIFEGAWQTAIDSGATARSNDETFLVINKLVLENKVKLVYLNQSTETDQRQRVLDYCRELGYDYLFAVDSDEVFCEESIQNIISKIKEIFNSNEYYGIKLCSYNFYPDFSTFYQGEYPRIYKLTPDATVLSTNHVYWPQSNRNTDNYLILNENKYKFYHLSYLRKNTDLFHIKMKFLEKEFGNNLYNQGYGEEDGKYKIPVSEFFNYTLDYPPEIQKLDIFKEWTNHKI